MKKIALFALVLSIQGFAVEFNVDCKGIGHAGKILGTFNTENNIHELSYVIAQKSEIISIHENLWTTGTYMDAVTGDHFLALNPMDGRFGEVVLFLNPDKTSTLVYKRKIYSYTCSITEL